MPLQGREVQHWGDTVNGNSSTKLLNTTGCQGSESPRIGVWLEPSRTELSDLQL